eukprot:6536462-Prymnesium_polylepis.1
MTKQRFVLHEQLINVQPTNNSSAKWQGSFDIDDPIDSQIFGAASRRFAADLVAFDISERTC